MTHLPVIRHFFLIEVKVHRSLGDILLFAVVTELWLLLREDRLEHIRVDELRARGCPHLTTAGVLLQGLPRRVHCVVGQDELVVGRLVLEVVPVLLAVLDDEVDDFLISVRDLHRIGLDVNDLVPALLQLVLQVDHEQSAALGDDVVLVPDVPERVVELRRRQSVDDVDRRSSERTQEHQHAAIVVFSIG